jgi:hypothetical protein
MLRAVAISIVLFGCAERSLTEADVQQHRVEYKDVPIRRPKQYDLLFVIDNSPAMSAHRANLVSNFKNFVNVLDTIEGGLPDMHIGVITTDLGTRGARDDASQIGRPVGACVGDGDGGALRHTAAVQGSFIIDAQRSPSDLSRVHNYAGTLAEAFTELADVGTTGCEFPQPLEAMKQALVEHPLNAGFLRDAAYLVIVFITAQDDCTFEHSTFLAADPHLGPLDPFRCTRQGVTCTDPNHCQPRATPYMPGIDRYASFLKGVKSNPNNVIVSGIGGSPTPFIVTTDASGGSVLEPSCTYEQSSAKPPVRLKAFLEKFPNRNTFSTICQQDFSGALTLFSGFGTVTGSPCFDGEILDADPSTPGLQPDCTVSDVQHLGRADQTEQVLPVCDASSSIRPCWHIEEDLQQCSVGSHQLLRVERDTFPPPDTHVVSYCEVAP